jgi:hypothetical protein
MDRISWVMDLAIHRFSVKRNEFFEYVVSIFGIHLEFGIHTEISVELTKQYLLFFHAREIKGRNLVRFMPFFG